MSVAETKVMPGEGTPRPDPLDKKTIIKGALELADDGRLTDNLLGKVTAAERADNQKILLEKKLTSDEIDKINTCLNILSPEELKAKAAAAAAKIGPGPLSILTEHGETKVLSEAEQDEGASSLGGGGGKTHKNIPVGLINSKKNKPKNSLKKNNQKSNIKTKKN